MNAMNDDPSDEGLRSRIGSLPPPSSELTADDVLRAAATRRGTPRWLAPAALAATAALAVGLWATGDTQRDRGGALTGPAVRLEAVAEGSGEVRALGERGRVSPREKVIFRMTTARHGWLLLHEDRRPMIAPMEVAAGQHVLGGETPMAWRPDDLEGARGDVPHKYEVWLCPEPRVSFSCAKDEVSLWWTIQ